GDRATRRSGSVGKLEEDVHGRLRRWRWWKFSIARPACLGHVGQDRESAADERRRDGSGGAGEARVRVRLVISRYELAGIESQRVLPRGCPGLEAKGHLKDRKTLA